MALAIHQGFVTDGAGNVIPGAKVRVRRETAGLPLATIYGDSEAASPIANPVTADAEGYFFFYARGSLGGYYLQAFAPGFERIYRNVPIGTAGQIDVEQIGLGVATDAHVDTLAERDDYDAEEEGFGVLVSDIGDGRAGVYTRVTSTPGTWAGPAIITGAPGTDGEDGVMTSIIAGAGIDVDATDPANPIVTAEEAEFAGGDFTPELLFDGLGVGITYDYALGRYTRHGDVVNAWVSFGLSSKGSSTGAATITLPFPSRAGLMLYAGSVAYFNNLTGVNQVGCSLLSGAPYLSLTTSGAALFITDAEIGNSTEITLHITYEAEPE